MSEQKLAVETSEVYINEDDVKAQIKEELKLSRDYMTVKRQEFRDRLKLYNNQKKQKDKVGDTSLYNIMNTLLAISYINELEISFVGRDIGQTTGAANTEKLAKFDYDEMELEIVNYLKEWDKYFFGVGIKYFGNWDKRRKVPIVESIDTLSWLPDPMGYLSMRNFRFMGFEREYSGHDLNKESGFINLSRLKDSKSMSDSEKEQTRVALREAQNYGSGDYQNLKNSDNSNYDLIDWLTHVKCSDGVVRKFLFTINEKVDDLFRFEEIEPVTEEEKENPALVPFKVSLHYMSPTRHDPCGVCVGDLTEDKQRAKSVLNNLFIAAQKADLYPMYLYNRQKIQNRRDLDFAFNKFIAVNGDIKNTAAPLNKAPVNHAQNLNILTHLDNEMENSTGAGKVAQGILSDQQRTLGEVETSLARGDLRFLLTSKISSWGEKRFWRLWYREYKQNFKDAEKKVVRVHSTVGDRYFTFGKKDFITKEDPDIFISSKLEAEQKKQKEKLAFTQILPLITQDPARPQTSKKVAERHLLRLHNLPSELIFMVSPDTPDEMRAKQENELLSHNDLVNVDVENEDHQSHILIHSMAEDTASKNDHIERHRRAYIQSGQKDLNEKLEAEANLEGGNKLSNISMNQIAAQNTALNNTNKATGPSTPDNTQ